MVVRNYQCQRKVSYSNTTSIYYWVISHGNYATENSNQYPVSKLQALVSLWNSHAMLKILFFQRTNWIIDRCYKIISQHFYNGCAIIAFQNENFHVSRAISCKNSLKSQYYAKLQFLYFSQELYLLAHVIREDNQTKTKLALQQSSSYLNT